MLFLGLGSLVVPIPRNEQQGVQAGGVSIGLTTQSEEKVSPILSAVMIVGGVALMIAGKERT